MTLWTSELLPFGYESYGVYLGSAPYRVCIVYAYDAW